MICECYRAEKNFVGKVGSCWGTAERDACSCGGDKSKCDFYPSVREKGKKPTTKADLLRAMTDEELAAKIEELCQYTLFQIKTYAKPNGREEWLEWLKQEVET
jgi:hypothetical protein